MDDKIKYLPKKDCGSSIFLPSLKAMIEPNIFFVFCDPYSSSSSGKGVAEATVWSLLDIMRSIATNKTFLDSTFYIFQWAIKTFCRACNAVCCIAGTKKMILVASELHCLLNYSDDNENF